ncbi:MAG: hypothetical protein JSW26_28030 [Desulfobacterales bacterium]|nr:MAG: hypothetical protein JSW26_28030 [Desulfobacterales bacterium]
MLLKRHKFWVTFLVIGILLTAAAAWKLLIPSAGNPLLYSQPKFTERETSRPGRFHENEPPQSQNDIAGKQRSDVEKKKAAESIVAPPPAPPPTPDLPGTSIFASEEEAYFFEMMNAALAEDFPELELSEIERIELFEVIGRIRESFEGTRSLARSAENAQAFQQLEWEREAAIEQFERIVGMSFNEFMLRTSVMDGGIDRY